MHQHALYKRTNKLCGEHVCWASGAEIACEKAQLSDQQYDGHTGNDRIGFSLFEAARFLAVAALVVPWGWQLNVMSLLLHIGDVIVSRFSSVSPSDANCFTHRHVQTPRKCTT